MQSGFWRCLDIGGSSLGFLKDGAGNREMLGFATRRIAFEGVMDYAIRAFGVEGAGPFGAEAGGAVVFGDGRMAGRVKGPGGGY